MSIEVYVSELLKGKGILCKDDLTITHLSDAFNIPIEYWEKSSKILFLFGRFFIFLDSRIDIISQHEEFLHELAHFVLGLYHFSNLRSYLYLENKVNRVVEALACPIHIFEKCDNIIDFSEEYRISYRLAEKRLRRLSILKVGENNGNNDKVRGKEWEYQLANQISY